MKQGYITFIVLIFSCTGDSRSSGNKVIQLADDDKEIVCFVYHRFGDSRYPSTNVSLKDFEAHLAYLVKHNFQVLSFSSAIAYLKSNEPVKRTAVITVDDGYKSFFRNGLPLLKKYSMPATLFINTETVGGGDYMDWSELETAVESDIEIGNHTHAHNYFMNESVVSRYQTFKQEIELSQSLVFKNLKVKPKVFSYPYGEFDLEMKDIVKNLGFKAATAQNSGVIYNGTDVYMCPRFPMSEAYAAPDKFAEKSSIKALRIESQTPKDFTLQQNKKPLLTLTFDGTDLLLGQLQCFVQGGECKLNIVENSGRRVTITIQAIKPISNRRRTLYTVTVPDKAGLWHWYSHLWINEKVN